MKQIGILLLFISFYTQAQTPRGEELIGLNNVPTTELTNVVAPIIGSILYNPTDEKVYVYTTTGWTAIGNNETYIQSGNAIITITGNGTQTDPYIVSAQPSTLTDNGDGTYTFSNGIDTDVIFSGAIPSPLISSSNAGTGCDGAMTGETTTFTITGENFTGDTTIDIPGQTVNSVTILSSTEISLNVTAGTTTGSFNITANNSNGTATLPNGYTIRNPLVTSTITTLNLDTTMGYVGGVLTKTSGGNSWNGNAHSTAPDGVLEAANDGSFSFNVSQNNRWMSIGIDAAPTLAHSWNTIDYSFRFRNNGTFIIYENSSLKLNNNTYSANDSFEIKKDCNGIVTFYQNGNLIYTSTTVATNDLFFDTSFWQITIPAASAHNIQITK